MPASTPPGRWTVRAGSLEPIENRGIKVDNTFHIDYEGSRIGLGGSPIPSAGVGIYNKLDTTGLMHYLPLISSLPNAAYTHQAVQMWSGGEAKFGPWRQYFNTWEFGWGVTYNHEYNPEDNTRGNRDKTDIVAQARFNVAEGDSGTNVFEINFGSYAGAGIAPDFNSAAAYEFHDGRISGQAVPSMFRIRAPGNVDALIRLKGHTTVNPAQVDLISDGVDQEFRITDSGKSTNYLKMDLVSGLNFLVGSGTIISGAFGHKLIKTATNYTADNETVILGSPTSANITVTFPDAIKTLNRIYHIKKIDNTAYNVIVKPSGTQLIDGTGSKVIVNQYDSIQSISDGGNWWII